MLLRGCCVAPCSRPTTALKPCPVWSDISAGKAGISLRCGGHSRGFPNGALPPVVTTGLRNLSPEPERAFEAPAKPTITTRHNL